MELSERDPLPVKEELDGAENEDENDDDADSVTASVGENDGEITNADYDDQRPDGASSYTSGTSDSDVWFIQAASEGNLVQVKRFLTELKAGDIKRFNQERDRLVNDYSALHMAARYNKQSVVDYLLDNNAPIDQKDEEDGNTPLLLAIKSVTFLKNLVSLLYQINMYKSPEASLDYKSFFRFFFD